MSATNVMIDSAEAKEGLRRLADGLESKPPVVLPDARTQDETDSRNAFAEGKVLFMRNWRITSGSPRRSAASLNMR